MITPMKKRIAKLAEKEQKSSGKKMTDKEFKQFCAEVQSSGVSAKPKANGILSAIKGKALASAVVSKRFLSSMSSAAASKRKRV